MRKFQISTLVEEMYTNKLIQKGHNSWSSFSKLLALTKIWEDEEEHFTQIKAWIWGKVLLKAEKEHHNRKSLFRQIRSLCVGIYMQVWVNHLKDNQTQSKWMGCKTWWGISLSLGCRLWLSSYTVLSLSLIEVLVDPQNHTLRKLGLKF